MGRKRTCELPFCNGVVEGTRNKRRCDADRNIHLHQVISKNVRKIMRYVEGCEDFTANEVNRDLFKNKLDKNEKGSMYRLFQAMVREAYLLEKGKREGLKVYRCRVVSAPETLESHEATGDSPSSHDHHHAPASAATSAEPVFPPPVMSPRDILTGKLREFIFMKNGQWNHDDWLWLINRPDILECGFPHDEIGRVLETEKVRYWTQR
jgi:hypothetical protein